MLVVYCCLFFVKKKCLYFIRVCFAILCCIHYLQISPQMQLSHVNNMRDRYFEELMDKHLVGESISTAVIKTQSLTYCYMYTRTLVWRWPILQYVSTVSAPGLMFRFSFSMGYYFMQGTSPTTLVERDSVTRFSILSSVKKVYLGSIWKVKTIPRNCSCSRSLFSHYMWS